MIDPMITPVPANKIPGRSPIALIANGFGGSIAPVLSPMIIAANILTSFGLTNAFRRPFMVRADVLRYVILHFLIIEAGQLARNR